MINLRDEYVRGFLRGLKNRVQATATALSWADGDPLYVDSELIGELPEDGEARAEFIRFARQIQNRGPYALKLRRTAAVGLITWSTVAPKRDALLKGLPRKRLARGVAKDLLVNGVAALWPVIRERVTSEKLGEVGREPTIQRLTGHLEILWDEDDVGGTPSGLLQITGNKATSLGDGPRYDTRIYDFRDGKIRVWSALAEPYAIADEPDETWPKGDGELLMPTVVWNDVDQYGYPVGEFKVNLPTLRQEVAQSMRILRTSQAHAYPIWALAGRWSDPETL
jgi:hypothetical protein